MDMSDYFVCRKNAAALGGEELLYVRTDAGEVPFLCTEWDDLTRLPREEFDRVAEFCREELLPCMTLKDVNFSFTSYGIKHAVEKKIGFYVANGTIKLILANAGIAGRSRGFRSPNLSYPLSKRLYRARFQQR